MKMFASSPEYKNFLSASQSATVRLDTLASPDEIAGLCTYGLHTCMCIVIIAGNRQRISLTHTATQADEKALIQECQWVGTPCTLFLIKGSSYANPHHELLRQTTTLFPRLEQAVRKTGAEIKIDTSLLNQPTPAVAVNKQGKIELLNKWLPFGQQAPYMDFRHAINMLNSNLPEGQFHSLDLQHDSRCWTRPPKVTEQGLSNIACPDLLGHATIYQNSLMEFKKIAHQRNKDAVKSYDNKNYDEAINGFKQAIDFFALASQTDQIKEAAYIHYNLGCAYQNKHLYYEALTHFKQTIDISRLCLGSEHDLTQRALLKYEKAAACQKTLPEQKKVASLSATASMGEKSFIEEDTASVERELQTKTLSFFHEAAPQWRVYPAGRLVGRYIGHQVRFFTLNPKKDQLAKLFSEQIKAAGFDVRLTTAKGKPSIIVDLTASKLSR